MKVIRGIDLGVNVVRCDLSVIIPCRNSAGTLGVQLDALSTQSGAPPFEILVVDNGSTDDIDAVVEGYQNVFGDSLRLIRAFGQPGASYARNVGIGAAIADKLLFCDADDCVSEYWVAHGYENLQRQVLFSGSAIPVSGADFDSLSVPRLRELIGDEAAYVPVDNWQTDTRHPVLMGGNFGIVRDYAISLGGFDQSLPSAGEDNDLAIRAQLDGTSVAVSPCSRLAYRSRTDPAAEARARFRGGVAHALICARYGLWRTSPHAKGVWWVLGPLRVAVAFLLMMIRPRHRDWSSLRMRWAVSTGLLAGWIRYGILRRVPAPRTGEGISEGLDLRP